MSIKWPEFYRDRQARPETPQLHSRGNFETGSSSSYEQFRLLREEMDRVEAQMEDLIEVQKSYNELMLMELRKAVTHLGSITDENITDGDVDNAS